MAFPNFTQYFCRNFGFGTGSVQNLLTLCRSIDPNIPDFVRSVNISTDGGSQFAPCSLSSGTASIRGGVILAGTVRNYQNVSLGQMYFQAVVAGQLYVEVIA